MTSGTEVQPEDLPPTLRATTAEPEPQVSRRPTLKELRESWLAAAETRYLTELLQECGGNVREAAQLANINMVTMYRLLKKRGLRLAKEIRGGSGP
jgi:DNA-binding NtrC family response regulator